MPDVAAARGHGAGGLGVAPPFSCFISFGTWIAATSRKTPPSTTAAIRARRSRTCAGVRAFFEAPSAARSRGRTGSADRSRPARRLSRWWRSPRVRRRRYGRAGHSRTRRGSAWRTSRSAALSRQGSRSWTSSCTWSTRNSLPSVRAFPRTSANGGPEPPEETLDARVRSVQDDLERDGRRAVGKRHPGRRVHGDQRRRRRCCGARKGEQNARHVVREGHRPRQLEDLRRADVAGAGLRAACVLTIWVCA